MTFETPRKSGTDPSTTPPAGNWARSIREIVESVAIAFVLAFLFRTFEAEAFVIPTGSMAPTLMGRHKDIICPKCAHRFKASASAEEDPQVQLWRAKRRFKNDQFDRRIRAQDTVAATCPMCGYTTLVAELEPDHRLDDSRQAREPVPQQSYNGDRILVSKFAYLLREPERWDVIVFKYPGDGNQNYIKRLVGLPGETIRLYQGDLFVKNRQGERGERGLDTFTIERKPPNKVLAMMQPVYDTNHDPVELRRGGWPLRWENYALSTGPDGLADSSPDAWQFEEADPAENLTQTYSIDGSAEGVAWLRYRHIVPEMDDWLDIDDAAGEPVFNDADRRRLVPQLITDSYAYNTEARRGQQRAERAWPLNSDLRPLNFRLGMHWVGDLLVECDVNVLGDTGELLLDLVEGGKHFTCTFDIESGKVTLTIEGLDGFAPTAQSSVRGPGKYALRFGNVDDQLLVWVDNALLDFGGPFGTAEYDGTAVFGERGPDRPQAERQDPKSGERIAGDLAPVGIGSRRAKLTVDRLRVLRDIYYIADAWDAPGARGAVITDLPRNDAAFSRLEVGSSRREGMHRFLTDPAAWQLLADRRWEDFPLRKSVDNPDGDQFFVLGDNSPSSKDARLWARPEQDQITFAEKRTGGSYVERKLLIGKALVVFWPHSWNRIPLIGIPLPYFPNFGDMRLIR